MSTPTLGAGLAPAGLSPAGFGTPATGDAVAPGTPLRQADGTGGQSRYIDAKTRDYAVNGEGRLQGIGGVQGRVQLALTTTLGSSILQTLGLTAWPGVITDAITEQVGDAVRRALKKLTDAGEVSIAAIEVTRPTANRLVTRVRWTDLTTGADHTSTL
jgi:hypothetical protein